MSSRSLQLFDPSGVLKPVGAGSGGLSQIAGYIDPENVSFALAKVPVGTGSFQRSKWILLSYNLEACPALRRARINTKKAEVKRALGDVHAELTFADKESATLDAIMAQLAGVFAGTDSTSGGISVSQMKKDYEEMLRKAAGGGDVEAAAKPNAGVVLSRKTATDIGGITGADVIKVLREPIGAFNWALFAASDKAGDLTLINAGSLSVPELIASLKPDDLAFGLLRLGFGSGRFRRIKWASLVWSGPSVGAVKRARAMQARAAMRSKLGPVSVEIEASTVDDVTLAAVIDKVKRATVVDGDDIHSEEDAFTVSAFLEALKEEAAASAGFFGDAGLVMEGPGSGAVDVSGVSAAEILTEMHRPGSEVNWAVFSVVGV